MTTRDIVAAALEATDCTQVAAAKKIGWSAQQLGQRLIRGSLRTDEFLMLMEALGIDVTFTVAKTGEPLKMRTAGVGHRVKAVSNGVHYDTAASEALANTFYEDGVHKYGVDGRAQELYIDKAGRYFLAEYSSIEGEKDGVRGIPASVAVSFMEKYGNKAITDEEAKTEAVQSDNGAPSQDSQD